MKVSNSLILFLLGQTYMYPSPRLPPGCCKMYQEIHHSNQDSTQHIRKYLPSRTTDGFKILAQNQPWRRYRSPPTQNYTYIPPPPLPGHPPPHPQPRIELHTPRAPRSMYQSSCTSEDRPWLTHFAPNALSFIKITCYTAKGTGVFYARPMRDLCSNVALMQAVCKQTFESQEIY